MLTEVIRMQFSSRLPVAVHILLALIVFEGKEKTTSAFLAGSVQVNPVIIRHTLGQLKAAGLVSVRAGEGGASLLRDPRDITLLDIFCAVEKDQPLFHFHENPNPDCPVGRNVHAVLDARLLAIQDTLRDALQAVPLSDLLSDLRRRMGP